MTQRHRPKRKYQIAGPHSMANQPTEIQTRTWSRFIRPTSRKTPGRSYREAPRPSVRRTTEKQERRWRVTAAGRDRSTIRSRCRSADAAPAAKDGSTPEQGKRNQRRRRDARAIYHEFKPKLLHHPRMMMSDRPALELGLWDANGPRRRNLPFLSTRLPISCTV